VVWRDERCAVVLNAYPYTTGHVMVLPVRHVAELEDLDGAESGALWAAAVDAVAALKAAYRPGGVNLGANLGRAAGAGVPGHLHLHALPRWDGDTNFMTSVAEARVLPEALPTTWRKLRDAWPRP
jgi:ATP adenylyltransferase